MIKSVSNIYIYINNNNKNYDYNIFTINTYIWSKGNTK